MGRIDGTEWTELGVDVKAEAFEGLLEKAASEGKKGAGQYFTPRHLIRAIVRCMQPDPRAHPEFTVCDPACGTGGFLVAAYEWLVAQSRGVFDRETARRVRTRTYFGQELVARPRRLALMNLYLHNLEPEISLHDSIYDQPLRRNYDVILTNPPFGTKGANESPHRDDFMVETTNKQLNFVQHVMTVLRTGGRAAMVLPDNCLFADQAGEVFSYLTQDCDLHTVLRLPRGTFSPYSPGTQTNVVFFRKGRRTERTWIYDGRTNVPAFTKKERPLVEDSFAAFERCYGPDPNGRAPRKPQDAEGDRWRSFGIAEVKEREYKIDSLRWLREESLEDGDGLAEPEALAADAIGELEAAIADLNAIIGLLETGAEVPTAGVVAV
jgi:type I restriction enzyme M protein